MIDWEYLLSQFKVRGELRPTSDEKLSAVEEEMGFVLPDSYKAFLRVFGPGSMNRRKVEFFAPNGGRTIQERNRALVALVEEYENPVAKSARFFSCANQPVDGFFWNLDEVTAPSSHEYRIYAFIHDEVYFMEDYFEEFMLHRVLSGDDGLAKGGHLVMDFTPWR